MLDEAKVQFLAFRNVTHPSCTGLGPFEGLMLPAVFSMLALLPSH